MARRPQSWRELRRGGEATTTQYETTVSTTTQNISESDYRSYGIAIKGYETEIAGLQQKISKYPNRPEYRQYLAEAQAAQAGLINTLGRQGYDYARTRAPQDYNTGGIYGTRAMRTAQAREQKAQQQDKALFSSIRQGTITPRSEYYKTKYGTEVKVTQSPGIQYVPAGTRYYNQNPFGVDIRTLPIGVSVGVAEKLGVFKKQQVVSDGKNRPLLVPVDWRESIVPIGLYQRPTNFNPTTQEREDVRSKVVAAYPQYFNNKTLTRIKRESERRPVSVFGIPIPILSKEYNRNFLISAAGRGIRTAFENAPKNRPAWTQKLGISLGESLEYNPLGNLLEVSASAGAGKLVGYGAGKLVQVSARGAAKASTAFFPRTGWRALIPTGFNRAKWLNRGITYGLGAYSIKSIASAKPEDIGAGLPGMIAGGVAFGRTYGKLTRTKVLDIQRLRMSNADLRNYGGWIGGTVRSPVVVKVVEYGNERTYVSVLQEQVFGAAGKRKGEFYGNVLSGITYDLAGRQQFLTSDIPAVIKVNPRKTLAGFVQRGTIVTSANTRVRTKPLEYMKDSLISLFDLEAIRTRGYSFKKQGNAYVIQDRTLSKFINEPTTFKKALLRITGEKYWQPNRKRARRINYFFIGKENEIAVSSMRGTSKLPKNVGGASSREVNAIFNMLERAGYYTKDEAVRARIGRKGNINIGRQYSGTETIRQPRTVPKGTNRYGIPIKPVETFSLEFPRLTSPRSIPSFATFIKRGTKQEEPRMLQPRTRSGYIPDVRIEPEMITRIASKPRELFRTTTRQRPRLDLIPRTTTRTTTTGIPGFIPGLPPGTPPPGFFPTIPPLGFGFGGGGRSRSARKYGYSPSLVALDFGITGTSLKRKGGYSGLELRPIPVARRRR